MTRTDMRGAPMSRGSERSLAAYETALAEFNGYMDDPVATIDAALAEEPDFVGGLILKAEMLISAWERSVLNEVRTVRGRLVGLESVANDRERGHIAAISAWVDGDWRGYGRRLDAVLVDHPRDLLALQAGHLSDFYHGDRDNLRGRIARALPAWTAADRGYAYVLGMQAFGHEESGDYARAEETGRHALALMPTDGWAQHAVAHVLEMQARQAEAIAFMETAADRWGRPGNAFAFHNWWHTAIYNLDLDRFDRVLQIYDMGVRPAASEVQLELVDAAALLWRLHLRGVEVGNRWADLADTYARTGEAGFYAFNDMHAMMAFAATGRAADAEALLDAMEAGAATVGTNGFMTRTVGLPIAAAIRAFGQGDYDEAVRQLLPVRYSAHQFGGSHAQRDVVHRTLIEASLRAGQTGLATALLQERTSLKRGCPFSWSWLERARAAAATARAA